MEPNTPKPSTPNLKPWGLLVSRFKKKCDRTPHPRTIIKTHIVYCIIGIFNIRGVGVLELGEGIERETPTFKHKSKIASFENAFIRFKVDA